MLFEIAKRVSRVLGHLIPRTLRVAIGDRVEDPAMHGARVHEALRGVLARCELAVDDPLQRGCKMDQDGVPGRRSER